MKKSLLVAAAVLFAIGAHSQKVDYSVVSVPEESGTEFKKITSDNDFVSMPDVRRSGRGVNWMSNRCLGLTVDGEKLAFLSKRDNATNIFLKSVHVFNQTFFGCFSISSSTCSIFHRTNLH